MKKEHLLGFGAAIAIIFFVYMAFASVMPAETEITDTVYQSAPFKWLSEGNYNGTISYAEILEHGDTGLGTFDKLDGEMILVDGFAYRVANDGTLHTVTGEMTTPFAEITYFNPDLVVKIDHPMNYSEIKDYISEILPSDATISTIRLDGLFSETLTRSVPAQDYPYRPLEEVISDEQTTFPNSNIKGTAIGFYYPEYMTGVNAEGFHLHFISEDRNYGGHLLDLTMESGTIAIDSEDSYTMMNPWTKDE
ncbi:acetolactate decarboxylase [Methanolacinia petrolearia]|uniref:acetolactate decarboxylase n=1 Tax=Methanolacinia petrolearia TaxID=54120 RepID=UPI003BA8DC11